MSVVVEPPAVLVVLQLTYDSDANLWSVAANSVFSLDADAAKVATLKARLPAVVAALLNDIER